MKKAVLGLLTLCGAIILTACGGLFASGPAPCNEGDALFHDDFEGEQDCGWAEYSRGGAVAGMREGVMQLSTSQLGQIWWTNPGRNFEDVDINVLVQQMSGPDNNAYGVICRYQSPENFYVFLISGDGYYAIGKYQSGSNQIVYLSGDGQYQFSDVINQGAASNQLRASCVGDQLSLMVNGISLATVTDDTFNRGDIGLAASTFELGRSIIHFDNLRVVGPQLEEVE